MDETLAKSGEIILSVKGLNKFYDSVQVLKDVNFDVYKNEILVILGPSGCGKSTTLRLLAGLERPDGAKIQLNGKTISDSGNRIFLPAEKRNLGMVFQSYAVWPHMTVEEHVAFPLIVRRIPKRDIVAKVKHLLQFVNLEGFEKRLASKLSGGQQQRLALARALVYEPDLLLLDEPLSNLDAQLRQLMRVELKNLQLRLGTSFVFVTHDQIEAMTLADRILLMKDGQIQQLGTPDELYQNPTSQFVHSFLGKTVHFEGQLAQEGGNVFIQLPGGYKLRAVNGKSRETLRGNNLEPGAMVHVTLRPQHLKLITEERKPQMDEIEAVVENTINLGDQYEIALKACDKQFVLTVHDLVVKKGAKILLRLETDQIKVWPS